MQNDGETVGDLRGSALQNRSYSTSLFALCYWSNGQYNEAEELFKGALAGNEKNLGLEHSETLRTVQNLANVYAGKGRYDEAEELYKRVLAGNEEKLGAKNPDTLGTVEGLAIVYTNKGRYDEHLLAERRSYERNIPTSCRPCEI